MDKKKLRPFINILVMVMMLFIAVTTSVAANKSARTPNYIIVIDAGHGGKDPGAQSGVYAEKDINLAVAKKLGEWITKNMKGVKVVYTRDDDSFLTLKQRAEKANNAKANLYISIHVNSADVTNPNRAALTGASVYVFGEGSGRNKDLIKRENGEVTVNPDANYKVDKRTVALANDILKQMKNIAGRKMRGVSSEPFYVLKATSMPAVLVELDFICNPNNAKFLDSKSGQNKLAKALFQAFRKYYKEDLEIMARQPAPVEETFEQTNGVTYVGDGYAIIGSKPSPARSVKKSTTPLPGKREMGKKRRSAAGRHASVANTRVQNSVNVCTHTSPQKIGSRPSAQKQVSQTTPQTAQQQANPASRRGNKSDMGKKTGNSKKKSVSNGNANTATNSQPSKKAVPNRKRGSNANTVAAAPQNTTPAPVRPTSATQPTAPKKADKPGKKQVAVKDATTGKPKTGDKEKEDNKKKDKKSRGNKAVKVQTATADVQPANAPSNNSRRPKLNRNSH